MNNKDIIEKYKLVIHFLARSLSREFMDDLTVVGNNSLLKAAETFDNQRKTKFMTYAFKNIKNAMRRELRRLSIFKSSEKSSTVFSLSEINEKDLQCNIEELILNREKAGTLKEAIKTLEYPYKDTIIMIYWNGLSLVETGKFLGVGSSRVAQIHKEALEKLKMLLGEEDGHLYKMRSLR